MGSDICGLCCTVSFTCCVYMKLFATGGHKKIVYVCCFLAVLQIISGNKVKIMLTGTLPWEHRDKNTTLGWVCNQLPYFFLRLGVQELPDKMIRFLKPTWQSILK